MIRHPQHIVSLALLLLTLVPTTLPARPLHVSLEVEAGAVLPLESQGESTIGWQAGAGVGLTQLWPVGNHHYRQARRIIRTHIPETALGWYAAAHFSYIHSTHTSAIRDQYQRTDYLGNRLSYNISGMVHDSRSDLAIEIPVMLAFHYRGLLIHAGIRNRIPFSTLGREDIQDLRIEAGYPAYGVTLTNELITGRATEQQLHRDLHISAIRYVAGPAIEVGYLASHYGILFAADYLPNAIRAHGTHDEQPVVDVAPILSPENPVPEVTITTKAYSLSTIGFSIRLMYFF